MEQKLLKIINHYGAINQRNKLCEEFREMQDELFYIYEIGCDRENLLSEIADVIILCLQFMYEYGYPNEELLKMMNFKINRQLERIKNEIH